MARMEKSGYVNCEGMKIHEKLGMSTKNKSTAEIDSDGTMVHETRTNTLVRAARSEISRVKADLKSKLPALTATEVRRHRIPRCESVILELREEGFGDAAEYMIMLFELDETMRMKAEPGSIVRNKPMLKDQKSFIERIRRQLTDAEIAKRSGNSLIQAKALLDVASFFESTTWEWFWIAEQLFRSSLKIAENVHNDEGQILNVIRYIYGRFLLNKMNDPEEAVNYLQEARINSHGKLWNASKILGFKQETLYRECCTILHKALISIAKRVRTDDPETSVRHSLHALERATDSVHDDYIADALYELGKSQLSNGDVESALRSLSKFLALAKRIPDPEAICNAHMELAFAYQKLEDSERTVKHLASFRECATRCELPYRLAQAHYYTGEYLLNKGQAKLATPHLELALDQFHSLGKNVEANRTRVAAGVSKGQEVIDRYIDLILNCNAGVTEATAKICLWKAKRLPFWTSTKMEESADGSSAADSDSPNDIKTISTIAKSLSMHGSTSTGINVEIIEIRKTSEESS